MGLTFRNDLGNAAGLDKDGSLLELNYRLGAGYALVGTVLDKPHTGNQEVLGTFNPWVPLPVSGNALNSLGLPSKGVDTAVKNIEAFKEKMKPKDFPIGLSVMGHPMQSGDEKLQGVLECVEKGIAAGVDFIEINESCPNVDHGHGGEDDLEKRIKAIVAVRDSHAKKVPILVKLGDFGDVEHTVKFMAELKIDGLVGLNTQKDYETFRPRLPAADRKVFDYYTKTHKGGFSGPMIYERSLAQLSEAAALVKKLKLPLTLVHVGGIMGESDVSESRKADIPLRQWYTGLMHGIAVRGKSAVYKGVTAGA